MPPLAVVRVVLSDGRSLSPPPPLLLTLGRAHVGKGAKKRATVSKAACVIDCVAATVAALAASRSPVVLERLRRRRSSFPSSSSAAASAPAPASASVLRRITIRPGGSPRALRDKDVLQICPGSEGDDAEEARKQRVVVEVEGGGGGRGGRQKRKRRRKDDGGGEGEEKGAPPPPPPRYSSPLIMLVLVGLPGSGKTTLGEALVAHAAAAAREFDAEERERREQKERGGGAGGEASGLGRRPRPRAWVRISQDAPNANLDLKKGKRRGSDDDGEEDFGGSDTGCGDDDGGSRGRRRGGNHGGGGGRGGSSRSGRTPLDACLSAAARSLAAGSCVVVDRTNLTAEQRAPFLRLAREGGERGEGQGAKKEKVELHALFLDRAVSECVDRVYFRAEHEGGFLGKETPAVVRKIAKGPLEPPVEEGDKEAEERRKRSPAAAPLAERFARVWVLSSDERNEAAAEEYGRGRVGRGAAAMGASDGGAEGGGGGGGGVGTVAAPPKKESKRSAFDLLMAPPAKKATPSPAAGVAASNHRKPPPPAFLNALRRISENPEKGQEEGAEVRRVAGKETNAPLLVLIDRFPKSRSHALVLQETVPGVRVVSSPRDLRPEDAGLVRDMLDAGRSWAETEQKSSTNNSSGSSSSSFRFGFHSSPSLEPMHLHAISQDLLGTSLKTKKHYNSFKSPFFVDAERVIEALEEKKTTPTTATTATTLPLPLLPLLSPEEAARALSAPLACHRCGVAIKNMPTLRQHLEEEHEK